ncbi:MAG: hypothetical protein HC896_10385 [Bacteroidales bacterium]|nr:hypothetical protein [Bacteroidales bacterium]
MPGNVSQAKFLHQLLDATNNPGVSPDDSIVVLADENLLKPVLYSLPTHIKQVNISMVYPFKGTEVYAYLGLLYELQKLAKQEVKGKHFYYKPVLALLQHELTQFGDKILCRQVIEKIKENNSVYISPEELQKNEILSLIFRTVNSKDDFVSYLLDVINLFIVRLQQHAEALNIETSLLLEFFAAAYLAVNQAQNMVLEKDIDLNVHTWFRLYQQVATGLGVPFVGEPLNGLQITGLLETRALDFDNVTILSANEGILPRTNSQVSFVPYTLRKVFGLPTKHQQEKFTHTIFTVFCNGQKTLTYCIAVCPMA